MTLISSFVQSVFVFYVKDSNISGANKHSKRCSRDSLVVTSSKVRHNKTGLYTLLKEIKQTTYLEKRTLVKNFSCRIQYSFYDEQPHGVGPDQNMKVQANGGMKYPIS